MKLVVIIGGTNDPSNAETLAEAFVEGVGRVEKSCEISTFRLRDMEVEHFTLKHYKKDAKQGKDFEKLEAAVKKADGVVVATPIWNFSVPGHLKNLIDRMGSFGLDPEVRSVGTLNGKPVYLIYTGGSPYVVWTGLQRRTLSHMPVSLRYFGMTIIGSHYEPRATLGKGKFGLIVHKRPESLSTMKQKGMAFGKVAQFYAKTGKLPLWQTFLKHLFRFGQKLKRKLGI